MANQENLTQAGSKTINPQDVFSMKRVQLKGSQYESLKGEIQLYLSQMTEAPSELEVLDSLSSFQTILSLDLKDIEFNKLTEAQKLCISMIYASDLYIDYLSTVACPITPKGEGSKEIHLQEDPRCPGFAKIQIPYDFTFRSSFAGDLPIPLKVIFNHLTQTKHCSCFIINWFYCYLTNTQLFDFATYNNLYESITEDNYERFHDMIINWDLVAIHDLSVSIDILFPLLLFIESNTNDADTILYNVRKEIFSGVSPEDEINISPITIFFLFIISYLFNNNLFLYLTHYQHDSVLTPFQAFISKNFMDIYNNWIDKEIEVMSNFFRKNSRFCTPMGTLEDTDNTNKKANNHAGKGTGQTIAQQQESDSRGENDKLADKIQNQPKDPEPKAEAPRHIEVPCSKEMLTKLAEGLVQGIDDESKPLVTSKVKERNSTIIKKLVCLFSGIGIHDESLEWPYNLKWADYANSLKLLVYLLNYEGELKDPLDAVDENDEEGIAKEIKQDFSGIPFWRIVGPALDYSERSLSSKAKIPVKNNNVGLMKKLAQFWYECKKLDD